MKNPFQPHSGNPEVTGNRFAPHSENPEPMKNRFEPASEKSDTMKNRWERHSGNPETSRRSRNRTPHLPRIIQSAHRDRDGSVRSGAHLPPARDIIHHRRQKALFLTAYSGKYAYVAFSVNHCPCALEKFAVFLSPVPALSTQPRAELIALYWRKLRCASMFSATFI